MTSGGTTREPAMRYAGFSLRASAMLIDFTLLWVVFVLVQLAVMAPGEMPQVGGAPAGDGGQQLYTGGLAWWVYKAVLHSSSWQGTVGKMVLGLRVTDQEGHRISFVRATLRYAAEVASYPLIGIGYLVAIFSRRRQALHDMVARTCVVQR
jgi:uncharacterized RDD family membrane protein YckC